MKVHFCLFLAALVATSSFAADDGSSKRHTSSYTVGSSIQPLVIYGEGWSQQFTIINVDYYQGGERTAGVLRFYTQSGQPWRIPIKNLGITDQAPVNLASGQMVLIETEVSQQPQQLGWAHFDVSSSSGNSGIYHAFTTFRKQTAGQADLMTNVPFVDDIEDEVIIPFDNRDGKYPGIGLVNSWSRPTTITLRVYDTTGVLRKTITKQVDAKNMIWFSLLAENADLNGFAGQIRVRPQNAFVGAFTLQFTPNGAFTAQPVVHTFGMP